MGRREELERDFEQTQEVIENLREDTPREVVDQWHAQLDSISFELNNLYDDYETRAE